MDLQGIAVGENVQYSTLSLSSLTLSRNIEGEDGWEEVAAEILHP
jgi:hypothetical protein